MNYTDELGLKLPELDEAFDLENHWNYNTQKIDAFAATTNTAVGTLESGLASAQSQIAALQGGVHLKGSVNYYADLPADPGDGDAYTVLYFGTSGQDPAGIEYAWVSAQNDWIPIGVDPAAFAKPADITAAIAALDVAEAGGSGKYISAISETNGKISATEATMDTTPTANSTVPVTSGGVAASQAAQDAEIAWNVNQGVKNLIELSPNTYTSGNVVVKLNDDGTVSVSLSSGSTANTTFSRAIKTITNLRDMDLILNGCPSGGNYSSGYALYISDDSTTKEKDEGNGVLVPKNTTVTTSYLALIVRSGTAISGTLTFKPMIRPASITDSTFVPYAKTNRELTVAEDEDRAALAEVIDGGAAGTKNHCTQASGSNNPSSDRWINIPVSDVGVGQWVMSFGKLTSTDTDDTLCQAICFNSSNQQVSNWVNFKREPNTNKTFTITDTVSYVRLYPANSYAASEGDTVTFTDAMLSPKVLYDADPSYVPYAPALTNVILTPALIKQVDEGSKNLLNLNTDFTSYTNKGITYENNSDGTIKVSGTSSSADSYMNLYDRNTDNLFGIQKGETVVIRSTSDNVSVNLIYKKSGGGYGLTVYGYKSSPGWFTVPSDFAGFLLRIGVPKNGTTVNENVEGMICTAANWAVSQKFVPYRPSWQEMWEMIQAMQSGGASTQSVQPALIAAAKAETQEQREEETDA